MGDRAHFSRPYMESDYDDDEGGKRKEKIRMMSGGKQAVAKRSRSCTNVQS